MPISRSRLVVVTAAGTGLAAGLALGVTGLASADTSGQSTTAAQQGGKHDGARHHGEHGDHHGRGALVTAVNGNTITLDTPRGTKTVTVNAGTTYRRGADKATLGDIKKGEIVLVRFVDPKATSLVAKAVRIELARGAGYVTSVNGSSFTIIGRDGFSRTVQESSGVTYRNGKATGSASDITVGKFVRAAGTVDPNGTTLDAARIATGEPSHEEHAPSGHSSTGDSSPSAG